ncbi:class I SAM-dependent rRNA methyltransferase [Aequorivita viscosa]|uniref:23S rRNA (Cytosine1962-C5)-methyltransferase n=1 Tax=Aequorivita viscosa TaxID=797419 RepID=A0A1M6LSS3_9FLAO|nr:class I SAM-dependent rRNA methyltransferase [Aequorivita viscosa]SDX25983.1 23S rRNA (cytosine1962-C5)-methyltransferase [Aequorivita viscosa]SHJ74215.1 23S rRNA (cytosine1962-C5)-methyltransferase [Aequorivita viscosa]
MTNPIALAVKLRIGAEKIVKQGHPWIFSDSIEKINKAGKAGDLAVLFDQRNNKVFGIGLYDPDSPIRIKMIHLGGSAKIDEMFFKEKIFEAFQIRKPLLETDTNAYRLIFGENDSLPGLIVDVYNKVGVVKLYSPIWLPYLKMIVPAIAEISNAESLVLRLSRNLQKMNIPSKEGDVLFGDFKNSIVSFKEYGVQFQADVLLGHKTGFFLDHRANRYKVGQISKNKTVLDVFSYAGGFSVHALSGGAKEVTSLDFSKQALELAKQNTQLNEHSGQHLILDGDAFVLLKELVTKKKQYDIVIIDPPSFAKSKKEIDVAKKKYAELTTLGIQLTRKKGILILASCSSRISANEFLEVHQEEFERLGVPFELEEFTQHDIDHPVAFDEGAYLKTGYYRIT